jgi:hypothetical protein
MALPRYVKVKPTIWILEASTQMERYLANHNAKLEDLGGKVVANCKAHRNPRSMLRSDACVIG